MCTYCVISDHLLRKMQEVVAKIAGPARSRVYNT